MANKKHDKIVAALTTAKKSLTANELAAASGVAGAELGANVKEMIALGLIEKDPNDGKKVQLVKAKAKAKTASTAKASAPAKKGKMAPAPVEEDEDEDEDEEAGEEEYTAEELDAFYAEYSELAKKAEKKALKGEDLKRFTGIEELLDEAGYFDQPDDADGEEADEDDEDDAEEDEDFGFEDDDDDAEEDDDEDEDEESAPKKDGKKSAPKKPFHLDFKAINTLTEEELTDGIEESLEAAEELHSQGFVWAADFLYRSIVKARKQLEKYEE